MYLVKQWVKNRKIHEPYKGYLSSYTYTLMVMHYLQVSNTLATPVQEQSQGNLSSYAYSSMVLR